MYVHVGSLLTESKKWPAISPVVNGFKACQDFSDSVFKGETNFVCSACV